MKRRDFITKTVLASAALTSLELYSSNPYNKTDLSHFNSTTLNNSDFFNISLAQWSLHRALRKKSMDNLDFAEKSRKFGCEGLEYVNVFFKDKAENKNYLKEMNNRAQSEGQQNVLIMIDGEGSLAHVNSTNRLQSIENHYKWVEAAHFLGCHSIRVNLAGSSDRSEGIKASVDSLNKLSDFAKDSNINILVENHGGFSSDGKWMTNIFSQVKNTNCGTLPDFGNFCIKKENKICVQEYDRYKGLKELLPYAKAVSAKSYDFDTNGEESTIDFHKAMKLVKKSGYRGFVGIEFEGNGVSEEKGIELTRDLLLKVRKKLS